MRGHKESFSSTKDAVMAHEMPIDWPTTPKPTHPSSLSDSSSRVDVVVTTDSWLVIADESRVNDANGARRADACAEALGEWLDIT